MVEPLIDELVTATNDDTGPVLVRAAMAHLNLTLIHPFSDGNGRMARCLQSYVLASAASLDRELDGRLPSHWRQAMQIVRDGDRVSTGDVKDALGVSLR